MLVGSDGYNNGLGEATGVKTARYSRYTPLKIPFSWVVVSAKLMGDSPENSPAIFIRGGELGSWVTVGV